MPEDQNIFDLDIIDKSPDEIHEAEEAANEAEENAAIKPAKRKIIKRGKRGKQGRTLTKEQKEEFKRKKEEKQKDVESRQLTEERKERALRFIVKYEEDEGKLPDVISIAKYAYNNFSLDPRSIEARSIRQLLVDQNLEEKTHNRPAFHKEYILTEENKEFIDNNLENLAPYEMAKIVFGDDTITQFHTQSKVVSRYVKQNHPDFEGSKNIPDGVYCAPRTINSCITRINCFATRKIDKDNLGPKQQKDILALMNFLKSPRFTSQINSYENQKDRDLFEANFVKYVYDKYDLTEEELDQYVILAGEVVNQSSLSRQIEMLRCERDRKFLEKGRTVSMPLIEAISKSQAEYNNCIKRQQDLFKVLTSSRADKLKDKLSASNSLLNFVELMKQEETRKKLLEIARRREDQQKNEIDRLRTLDDAIGRIMGSPEDLALYG